jgi:hypothetical protein
VTNHEFHNMVLWSVAAFFDSPLSPYREDCLSAYIGYFNLDYGPNYLRYNGIMNPADGIVNPVVAGAQGNAFPMFGTGEVLYAQLGYLLPASVLGPSHGNLMPYFSVMHANFDRVSSATDVFNAGVSWLVNGHNTKITLDIQNRPVYTMEGQSMSEEGHRTQLVLQYQILL